MSEANVNVMEAARQGDRSQVRDLLRDGDDVDARDEQGWTALCHAAGGGDADTVRLLLEMGADPTLSGRDERTPLMIARAAGHGEVVEVLTEAEKERGVWEDPSQTRPYCKAYHLRDLRAWDDWSEAPAEGEDAEPLDDDSVVFVHQDFTVTRSMWHGEDVVFDEVDDSWRDFCRQELGFAIPADLL